ncbi:CRISPR-associated endoribonuclease Cas6 [Sporomusa termitida]|uniref:CRISPR-associated endoribonuclease Cas6 n=1 Tax=Sporomusa termitida TaxID=2377 RepID=A0A517DYC8_9FIRM|nr:CRISPR-associated endoribonuclease Cas6 [Sporomusa termitida]QDR82369.1 CRISPR-associated endoribonuclease Cas6 [Sporomusa termitida]
MLFELKLTVLLKKSTHHLQMQEPIGNWISQAQLTDPLFKQTHYDKIYKHFVFSNLYPTEKDGIYQQGRIYVLTIRSSIEDTLNRIHQCLKKCRESDYFQLVACEQRTRRLGHITELLTITPAIVTIENQKPWTPEDNIELLIQRLEANAEKKFKSLYPDTLVQAGQTFIQGITIENRKPLATAYKGRKLLGNKLHLLIHEDEYAQKLANVVMGSGLAEKGSILGAGFCLAKYLK